MGRMAYMNLPPGVVLLRDCKASKVKGQLILRGVLDVRSFAAKEENRLRIGKYQRAELPVEDFDDWVNSYGSGLVDDIVLGMRGVRIGIPGEEFPELAADETYLLDETYVVDGQQRLAAARKVLADGRVTPYLGARVLFGTTEASEAVLFDNTNNRRRRLSPNVTLRNLVERSTVLAAVHRFTTEGTVDDSVEVEIGAANLLVKRVAWDRVGAGDLMGAVSLIKILSELHNHLGTTRSSDSKALVAGLLRATDAEKGKITAEQMMANMIAFFNFVEELWQLSAVTDRKKAGVAREVFLTAVARLFSQHRDFWRNGSDGTELSVKLRDRGKLEKIGAQDPFVMSLATTKQVQDHLRAEVDKGRKEGKLQTWK